MNVRQGNIVYFTAFLKEDKKCFYLCKGLVEHIRKNNKGKLFRVKIEAISDAPIGSKETTNQAVLIGRRITKREDQIYAEIPFFMQPRGWLVEE